MSFFVFFQNYDAILQNSFSLFLNFWNLPYDLHVIFRICFLFSFYFSALQYCTCGRAIAGWLGVVGVNELTGDRELQEGTREQVVELFGML